MSRRALLIATSHYADPQIATLRAPAADAQGLREVLADPGIGGFEVRHCLESTTEQWRHGIADFFLGAKREDLLLLYISGHGVKDKDGKLYFASTDTRLDRLLATGVAASFIQEAAQNSRSRRVLMLLDTCFSGAFARGFQHRGDSPVNTGEYFRDSTGMVVITASGALQYALEEDSVTSIGQPSLFTRHLIQGLKTGEADKDGDGQVTSEDLFKYVLEKVRAETQAQRPQRWAFDLDGDFIVATNPRPRPATLPEDLTELMGHRLPKLRVQAVMDLAERAKSRSLPMALAARQGLLRLAADPDPIVRGSAAAALADGGEALPPGTRTQSPPDRDDALLEASRREAQRQEAGRQEAERHRIVQETMRKAQADEQARAAAQARAGGGIEEESRRGVRARIAADARRAPRYPSVNAPAEGGQGSRWRRWAIAAGAVMAGIVGVMLMPHNTPDANLPAATEVAASDSSEPSTASASAASQASAGCTVCPEMVVIHPGTFQMGSPDSEEGREGNEGPVHPVNIRYSFEVSMYPITRGQWRQYLSGRAGSGNCYGFDGKGSFHLKPEYSWKNPGFPQEDNHPAVCVTWEETQAYIAWLNQQSGRHYRLLTEAEYEYVNRAESRTAYPWGSRSEDQCKHANGADSSAKSRFPGWTTAICSDGFVFTSPVGSFPANGFGLYDMSGNVLSWTQDCYHDSYKGAPADGSAWEGGADCARRVVRGGAWDNLPQWLRSAQRLGLDGTINDVGFRLARTI